jgi:UDP-N-acetylmuramoyl-tripeptide--D-alanyl-D-alanine ligase
VLAGVAIAIVAGRTLHELTDAIARLSPVEHRLQLIDGTGGVTVIDDAYNSNPDGADAALELLAAFPGGRKVVVTPGMIELGPLQFEANKAFGEKAAQVADTLIVVARSNRDAILAGAANVNGAAEVITVDSLEQASARLATLLRSGDVVLFENDLPDQYEG